jgi:predicted DNA-binding protein (MmcQ/YjbR family)
MPIADRFQRPPSHLFRVAHFVRSQRMSGPIALAPAARTEYLRIMDAERLRAYLLTLPHAAETMQWGANLVFWVGDKTIGGKMFALINLDEPTQSQAAARKPHPLISYPAGPDRFAELVELEGLVPAPYLARAHWIAALDYDVFTPAEWRRELAAAHGLVLAKLPPKTRRLLK